jgi:DnaJ-class molecular chaperone
MQSKKISVQHLTSDYPKAETIGSLMTKIVASAHELQRTLDSKPSDFLALSFFNTKPCEGCEGKGFVNVADGPDDFEKFPCGACNGTGRVVANK